MSGLNFERRPASIGVTSTACSRMADDPNPARCSSSPAPRGIPAGLRRRASAAAAAARRHAALWIGNTRHGPDAFRSARATSPAWSAGAAASRCFRPNRSRTSTSGPIEFTPSGTPISMVPLTTPDLARFPRFTEALRPRAAGRTRPRRRDLHSLRLVASRRIADAVQRARQLLVEQGAADSAHRSMLLHAALTPARPAARTARSLAGHLRAPACSRRSDEVALAHLPPEQRGLLGPPSPERAQAIRGILVRAVPAPMETIG